MKINLTLSLISMLVLTSCGSQKSVKQSNEQRALEALKRVDASDLVYKNRKVRTVGLLPNHKRSDHEAIANEGMITTQGKNSTRAGLRMLQLGGNAFDAAAAVSFAISVERPQSTGIGGGGFMLIDKNEFKVPITLDFREKAPLAATSDMFINPDGTPNGDKSLNGIYSSAVPGLVKGVLEMHEKYGSLTREVVMQPAIDLAEKGFSVYPHLASALKRRKDELSKYPATRKIFFRNGSPLKEGDWLIQRDLGKTLREIQKKGVDGFYKGWVANEIVKESKRLKGLITQADLDKYNVKWRAPVKGTYKGLDIYSMAPPSSGGTHVIQILNLLEPYELGKLGVQNPKTIHLTSTAMQLAFYDRAKYMGDSDFVIVPVNGLISKEYAWNQRRYMTRKALDTKDHKMVEPFPYESDETTHFTIMDSKGNVVSSTQTINYLMGSGIVVPNTGIVLNDEMDDFSKVAGDSNVFGAVGSTQNLVAPEKRPLSSMSPTLVKYNDKPVLALGSPSGTRILTCVAQVILNYIEHGLPLWEAVAATRYHHQWKPNEVRVGDPGFQEDVYENLKSRGHKINNKNLGCKIQAIAAENLQLHGVSDPRGEGYAKGVN